MVKLIEHAPEGVHLNVLNYLNEHPRGFVLDAPCGQGAISQDLEKMGFKAFLGDIERNNILYRNGRSVQLNLNAFLPFKNQIFDYLICIEGIEHLENPHHLVREFARVLKEGGHLIITTPNVMTIKSRWRFLFYSYLDYFRYFGPIPSYEKHQIHEYDHQHINPLFYEEIKFILTKYGFRIRTILTNRMVKKRICGFSIIKRLILYQTKKKFPDDPNYLSDILLEGEILIIVAQK